MNRKIDNTKARAMYRRGRTDREIAEAFGVTVMGVRNWRARNGLPTKHGKASTLHERAEDVRRLAEQGRTRAEIAIALKLGQAAIDEVCAVFKIETKMRSVAPVPAKPKPFEGEPRTPLELWHQIATRENAAMYRSLRRAQQ